MHSPLSSQCDLQYSVLVQSGQVQFSSAEHTPPSLLLHPPFDGLHLLDLKKQSLQEQSSPASVSHLPSSTQRLVQVAASAQSAHSQVSGLAANAAQNPSG